MEPDIYKRLALKWVAKPLNQNGFHKKLVVAREWDCLLDALLDTGLFDQLPEETDYSDTTSEELVALLKNSTHLREDIKIADTVLGKNIKTLGEQIGLSQDEVDILAFLILSKQERLLYLVAGHYGKLNNPRLCYVIADMMHIEVARVAEALAPMGTLVKSSLVVLHNVQDIYYDKVDFVNDIDQFLADSLLSIDQIAGFFIQPVKVIKHALADFEHLNDDIDYLLPYLRTALQSKTKGCNVLLYGSAGTGKTEFVKTISKALNADLYEVDTESKSNGQIEAKERINSHQLGMMILGNNGRNLILFDEMEDIFQISSVNTEWRSTGEVKSKSWFNRILETNLIPTLWTCNKIDKLDSAFLRRFDIVIEMQPPPRQHRFKIMKEQLPEFETEWVEYVANTLPISAADGARIGKVVHMARSNGQSQAHATRLLKQSYKAITGKKVDIESGYQSHSGNPYQLAWINSNVDISKICHSLSQHKKGTVCLYGPPGTGKTQLAYHIATKANIPVHAKKTSDLVSSYVGVTEKNIAIAFEQAEQENALLLIDEADSFFSDRSNHQRSWETTQVNELLSQLDKFNGLFIASTNLIDNFDPASKRRFDFKIAFDYPNLDQVWDMFCHYVTRPDSGYKEHLKRISPLTPGNFKVAERQAKLLGEKLSPESLLMILELESKSNRTSSRPIGFINS